MKKKTITANHWLKEILKERIVTGVPDKVPAGWMTLRQMSEEGGLSESAMRSRVKALMLQKRIKEKSFRIWTGHQIAPTKHYHPA